MLVGEHCNREVVVVGAEDSVLEAAKVMREYHVGDVVVVEEKYGKQSPIGIMTDRDIVLEIVAEGADPGNIRVGDAMSFDLVKVSHDDDLMSAIETMRDKSVRRVPVVDANDVLIGILSVDDLLDLCSEVMIDIVNLVGRQQRRETRTRP
ncbi:MAG: CBS domain-containing protein [Gammaproteobacteria bacterium]|jgi:CBS domain-containing protein